MCDGDQNTHSPQIQTKGLARPGSDTLYKVLLIGDSGVGKSSLILRFADNAFSDMYISTVGVDFKIRDFSIDGEKILLQIWDTAGQERFRTITASFFRGAHAIVVVYDITKPDTLANVTKWLDEITRSAPPDVKRILVGNKTDLAKDRQVTTKEGQDLAKSRKMVFFETSAKDASNVKEMFLKVALQVHGSEV